MITAGRCTLFLASLLLLSSSWEHSKFGANGQGVVTIVDVLLNINNDEFILERQAASNYTIDAVSGPTSVAGTQVTGTNLWQLDVFLTNGTRQNPDLSPTARVQATSVTSFPNADAPPPGELLRFNNVEVTFDLSSITCGSFDLICVDIQKGSNPSPDFQLVPATQPGCVNIVCRGVVINLVEPSIQNRNSVLQGVQSNTLELVIQLTADAMYRSVEGRSLVDVEVFGNLQPDGRGVRYPAITNPMQSVSYGIANSEVSVLPLVTATLDLSSVGCNQLSYICVDVQKASSPTPPYTLEFVPPEASIACREIFCTELEVMSGRFTSSPLGEYKASHFVTFPTITFVSNSSGGSVAASTGALWSLEIAVADSTMNIYDNSRTLATIPPGQDGRAFLAGSTLIFSGVTATLDLSPYECQEIGFIAITLLKNDNSPVDFTLLSQAWYEAADCRGLTITGVTLSPSSLSPNGFPLREWTLNQDMLFDVTFDTDSRYGSVQGTGLWVLQVAVSNAPSPNFASLTSTPASLNTAEMDMGVEGGNPLTFQDTSVSLSYLDSCRTTKYFCVSISKGANPSVDNGDDFRLSGQGVGCMVVECVGISITAISLTASPQTISEHSLPRFTIEASVTADPNAGSARGETLATLLWNMRVVLNRDENLDVTTSSSFPVSGDVSGAAERRGISSSASGGVTFLPPITSDVFLGASCEDLRFICLIMVQDPSAVNVFTYDPVNNVQFGCTPLDISNCNGVVIQSLPVRILNGDPVRENEQANQIISLEFDAIPAAGSIRMSDSGSNYWQVVAFGSQSPIGDGDRVALEDPVGLSALQRSIALSPSISSQFGMVSYDLIMDGIDCSRLTHICLELRKNTQAPLPSPDFSLQGDSVGCIAVRCTGVEIQSTSVSVLSGGFREGASENSLIVSVTMTAGPGSAGVSGENLWNLFLFSNNQADGMGPTRRVQMNLPQAVTWSGAAVMNGQAVLSDVDLTGYFDLTSVLCLEVAYVCLTVSQGPSPSTPFTLTEINPGRSLTGCVSVTCNGFTVSALQLVINPPLAIAIEHSSNPVAASFSAMFMSSVDNEIIQGVNLWNLDVFLNDQMSGNGNRQMTTVTLSNLGPEGIQRLNPGQEVTFDNIMANIPVNNFVCPAGQTYLCVQLQKNPSLSFTLLPPDPICQPIECRGLSITSVSINQLTGNPFVEAAAEHPVNLEVTINTDPNWAGVIGQRLWTYTVYLSPTDSHSINRLGTDPSGGYILGTQIVVAGQPFVNQVNANLNLANVLCQDAAFICLIVSKGASPSVMYTFETTEETVRRACQPIMCQGVDLVSLGPNIITGAPFLERNPSQMLQVMLSLSFSETSASIAGSSFWDIEFFTSSSSVGTGNRPIMTSFSDVDGNVVQGQMTDLGPFALNFDFSNTATVCSDLRYLCVQVSQSMNSVPDFRLNPAQLVQCVSVNCVGTVITNPVLTITSPSTILEVVQNRVDGVITYQAMAGFADLSDMNGQDIWAFTMFTNDLPDGSGQRAVEEILHRPGSIAAGGSRTDVLTFQLDLFNYICNSVGGDYLCVEIGPGRHFDTEWDVTYPDPVCSQVLCSGARFDSFTANVGTSVLVEYATSHVFTFSLDADTAAGTTTVMNRTNANQQVIRNVWEISLLGDTVDCLQQPNSDFYLSTAASLTPEQSTFPFVGGIPFQIQDIRTALNLSSFYCPEENYFLCVTLGKNPNSIPDFTLENPVADPTVCGLPRPLLTDCQMVECRGVLVQETRVVIDSSQFVRERQINEQVAFDLTVTSSLDGASAEGSLLWTISTYISLASDGSDPQYGLNTAPLSAAQMGLGIPAGDTVSFGNIVTSMDLREFTACPQVLYFCATLDKDPNPSRPFKLEGQLTNCVAIDCRGVVIISRQGTSYPSSILREGTGDSNIMIDVEYMADINGASVEGTNLWEILVFANSDPDGRGVRHGETVGVLPLNGGNFPLRAGQRTVFAPVTATLNLGNAFGVYRTCAEIQHVCGLLRRSSDSSVSFTLQAQPSFANIACARFECSGVILDRTTLAPVTPLNVVEDSREFQLFFNLVLLVHSTSSVIPRGGSNRWRVTVFGNSRSDGLGLRTREVEILVASPLDQSGVTPSLETTLVNLEATLDFRDEFCATLQFICAEVSVPSNADPLFRLNGFNSEIERLIGCQSTSCIGVRVTGGNIVVPQTTTLIEGLQNHVVERIDIFFVTHESGAGVSAAGEDLWTITVFLASDMRGDNPYSEVLVTLPGSASSQTLIAGDTLNFASTSVSLDTRTLSCSSDPFICATLGSNPSRGFSLNGYIPETDTFDENLLTVCTRISCDGVVIEENTVEVIQPVGPILAREDSEFCFNVTLSFSQDGGSVIGSDLFEFEAYMSQDADGANIIENSQTSIILRPDQTSINAINGQSSAFDNLKANLSLGFFNCPSNIGYFCVRTREGPNSNPSYTLSGIVIGCAEISCRGITVESSSLQLVSPASVLENNDEQIATFDFTLTLAANSAGFNQQERLWNRFRVYTANSAGVPVGNLDAFSFLSFEQASTVLAGGQVSVIRSVAVNPFDTSNTLCSNIPMFCVSLEPNAGFSVEFLNNADTACAPIACRGVEISAVNILSDSPEVLERSEGNIFNVDAAVESDASGASIAGINLWNIVAFFDDQADCQGNRFPSTRSSELTTSFSNLPLTAGQTLSLTNLVFFMNVENLVCPSGPLFLCIEFDKQQITTPPFMLSFPNGEGTKYSSVEARCRGVEVTSTNLGIPVEQRTVREGDTSFNFEVSFFAASTPQSAPLMGTNLWELTIYGSQTGDGLTNEEFPTKVPITTQALRDQSIPRPFLAFASLQVTVNLRGVRCANYQYMCVRLDRDLGSDPAYSLIGVPRDTSLPEVAGRTACQKVSCAGVELDVFVAGLSQGTIIFENQPDQVIQGAVSVQSHPNATAAVGNNYWRLFVFFNDQQDGLGPAGRISETEMTIPAASRTQPLPAGGSIFFNPAFATVNFETSCRIGEYMCFEIFNGMDLQAPLVTLLDNVVHCFDVICQGLLVSQTSLEIQTGLTFFEGETAQDVSFDVTVTSSSLGADGPAVPSWQISAFISSADNSNGIIGNSILNSTIIQNVLSPAMQARQLSRGSSVTFSNIQASFSLEGHLCESTRFLCVEFGVAEGASHSVEPVDNQPERLVDCQALACTVDNKTADVEGYSSIGDVHKYRQVSLALVITSTSLLIRNGEPLISNEQSQDLVLTFEFQTALSSISLTGQGLFDIVIFPNDATDGQGTTPLNTRTTFQQRQVTSIVAGTISSVESFRVSISLEGIRCDQMPYMCGTFMRGQSPSQQYTLQPDVGDPILTACTRMLDCVGVIITQFDVSVDPASLPVPEDANSHVISSEITVASSPNGASVNSLNTWAVRVFMSTSSDGSGPRFFETMSSIGAAASEPLPAGGALGPFTSTAVLSLDGFSCATTQYLCHEFTKTDTVSPDFTLEASPSLPNGLLDCRLFLCRAVEFDSVTFFVDPNQGSSDVPFRVFEYSPSFEFSLDVSIMVASGSVAVSGSNLWMVTAFFNEQADGTGMRHSPLHAAIDYEYFMSQGETVAALTAAQGQVSINPGQVSQLNNVVATSDLTGVGCQRLQYLCIEPWKGANSNPEYGIDVPASQADLRQCLPISCAGVEIVQVTPSLSPGSPVLIDRSPVEQVLTFDLTVEANNLAGGIQGSDLWAVEAYIAADNNVANSNHVQISPVAATIQPLEANKPLIVSQPLSLERIEASLDLTSASCVDVVYLCTTLQKSQGANPDFSISGLSSSSSLTGCTQVQCADAGVIRTDMVHGPDSILEGDPSHTILMNITVEPSDFGRAIFNDPLWQFTVTVTHSNPSVTTTPVVVDSSLTVTQRNADFIPGGTVSFTNVRATLNLEELSCQELESFCVRIGFVQNLNLVGMPDESSLVGCSEVIGCGEFEVSLQVVSYDERTITISWSGGVGDFDLYEITYTPESGSTLSPLSVARFGQRQLDFQDLTPGVLYTITIQLMKGSVRKEGTRTVTQRTRPEQVRGLTVQDVNSQSMMASWDDAGGTFDNYIVTLDPMDGFPASPVTLPQDRTTVTFNNLVIATRYTVTVVTRSGNEDSVPSRADGLTTPTPPSLRVEETTSDRVTLSWSPPAGYVPTRYELSWTDAFSVVNVETIQDVDIRTIAIDGLVPATRYEFNLQALVERSGTTASSVPSLAIGTTVPDVPVISDIVVGATSIELSLSLPRGIADSYEMDFRPLTTIARSTFSIPYQQPTVRYSITDLQSVTEYSIEVVSLFGDLVSNRQSVVVMTVIEGPTNLVVFDVTSTSVSVEWDQAQGRRDDYLVTASYPGNLPTSMRTPGTSFTVDNLPAYVTVNITVQTRYLLPQTGQVVLSNPLSVQQRTDGDIPGPVRNARAVQVSNERMITIEFEIPEMVNGDLLEFIVAYTETRDTSVVSTTTSTIMVLSQDVTFYTKSFTNNVNRGSVYVFSITARNNFGDGPSVGTNTVFINYTAPMVNSPINEAIMAITPSQNELDVTFSRDLFTIDGGAIDNYTVIIAELGQFVEDVPTTNPLASYDQSPLGPYQAFVPRSWPSTGNVRVVLGDDQICGSFTYCNPPLTPGTTYLVAIRVYNQAGFQTSGFMEFTTDPSNFLTDNLPFFIGGGALLLVLLVILIVIIACCLRRSSEGSPSTPRKSRKRSFSGSSINSDGGFDNVNLNNAVTMIYNPGRRLSSVPSIASRFDSGAGVVTRPVRLHDFAGHIGRLSSNSQDGFEQEFESLYNFGLGQPSTAAMMPVNKSKNRFSNILPYDTSRVVLHGSDDYINASFIQGFHRPQEFIATQGPMDHTVNDFWRMIWEQQVPVVVMICDIIEGGKVKCEQYWPPLGEPTAYGEVIVTMLSEKETTKGKEREFKVEIGEHSRTVAHYQFLSWPDKGVPSDTKLFTLFVKDIRSKMTALSGPVVVHCSDGASRTGVFITLDIVMQALDNETDSLDIYGVVTRLRKDRINMVLSKNYYVFIHQAILDVLMAQVSDSNWTFGASGSSPRYEFVPLDDESDLLGSESHL